MHFVLKPERRFIAPSFTVEHFSGGHSEVIPSGADLLHCFYRGKVDNDSASSAVFDLCSGMVSTCNLLLTRFVIGYSCSRILPYLCTILLAF